MAPNDPAPVLGLAEVAKLRNDMKGVESRIREALKIAPQNAEVQLAWGRFEYARKKYAEAERALGQARKLDPKLITVYLDLGDLYLGGIFRPKDAEKAFREAIRLNPDHAGAHNGLANALVFQKRGDEAIGEFETAARIAPKNPLPLHTLGRYYQYSGQADKALAAYDRALKVSPEFTPALLDRGDVYAGKNQADRALADYSAAIKLAPHHADAQFRLGMFYQSRSRNAEANATYLALIQSNPHFAPAYNNLACLAIELKGDLNEALVWAKKAVELQSGEPEYIDTLGQIYRARGDLKNAIAQFGHAAESRPARAEYYYHLGQALVATGAEKDGSKALRRAIEINKNFPGADDARKAIARLGK